MMDDLNRWGGWHSRRFSFPNRRQAFTLIELLDVIAIIVAAGPALWDVPISIPQDKSCKT